MMVFASLLDFFLPRICPICGTGLSPGDTFACDSCKLLIPRASPELMSSESVRKFSGEGLITGFAALYIFRKDSGLQTIIHELKYGNRFVTGRYLGRELASNLQQTIQGWSADCLVPVPLYHVKKAERGYNQTDFICLGISDISGLPVKRGLIKRIRFTETQTQLNFTQRRKNVEGAFRVKHSGRIKGIKVILVDDVVTTGATIGECAKALREKGAAEIFALSVALAG